MVTERYVRRHGACRGAVLVEFAIVAMLLIFLVFGILEFGMLIKDDLAIQHAALEGARTAALGEPTSAIVARVIASVPTTPLTSSDVTLEKQASGAGSWGALGNNGTQNDAAPGDYIRVTVRINHRWMTGLFSPSTSPIRAELSTRRD
ncbi:MAG TPA: TadE/TadG family type IV pilus assembly protein [Armatimonadota bacterium]|jgi:Flp pilus assembly protein TadG